MLKVANHMSPNIINGVFRLRNAPRYNLQYSSHFSTDPIHSDYNRTESASYLGPKIWEQYLLKSKISISSMFIRKILKSENLKRVHVEFVRLLNQI